MSNYTPEQRAHLDYIRVLVAEATKEDRINEMKVDIDDITKDIEGTDEIVNRIIDSQIDIHQSVSILVS